MSKDLFSNQSELYARYRPGYPIELIEYILQFVPDRDRAWDCATGNGQAALLLVSYFTIVHATDISDKQLLNAVPHPRIQYSNSIAEKTDFEDHCFDLVTVAQAYHWLDFTAFETELKRVLKPEGIVAVWGYSQVSCDYAELNDLIHVFYKETVGPYWDPERKYVDEQYETVPFPFYELPGRKFIIQQQWNLHDLTGYLNTWSSVQQFTSIKGFNPVDELKINLEKAWPSHHGISFRFPVFLRLGKIKND